MRVPEADLDWHTALRRLQNHANLPGHGPEEESFVFALFTTDRKAASPSQAALTEDVLRCLAILNSAMNASKSVPADSLQSAAYSVAAILSSTLEYARRWRDQGRFDVSVLSDLGMFAWRIAFAWEQVLAGDIEDLTENLALEEAARFPRGE